MLSSSSSSRARMRPTRRAPLGARRTTTVGLAQPLGERAVLEVQQGMPVPVTITT
jgi:hypothetical protein